AATPHAAADIVSKAVALGATPFPTVAIFLPSSTPSLTAAQLQTATAASAATAAGRAVTATPRPAGTPSIAATARPGNLQILSGTLSEYSISLPQISANPGTVRFTMSNIGQIRHNLRVAGSGVDTKLADLRPGQNGSVDVTFAEPGPYMVYCDLADHADRGMSLTFT